MCWTYSRLPISLVSLLLASASLCALWSLLGAMTSMSFAIKCSQTKSCIRGSENTDAYGWANSSVSRVVWWALLQLQVQLHNSRELSRSGALRIATHLQQRSVSTLRSHEYAFVKTPTLALASLPDWSWHSSGRWTSSVPFAQRGSWTCQKEQEEAKTS